MIDYSRLSSSLWPTEQGCRVSTHLDPPWTTSTPWIKPLGWGSAEPMLKWAVTLLVPCFYCQGPSQSLSFHPVFHTHIKLWHRDQEPLNVPYFATQTPLIWVQLTAKPTHLWPPRKHLQGRNAAVKIPTPTWIPGVHFPSLKSDNLLALRIFHQCQDNPEGEIFSFFLRPWDN